MVRKFSSKRKVRIVRPKVRDRRKQECKSEFFTGKGESMTLSLLAKVRFLRRKNEVSTLLDRGLDGVTILPPLIAGMPWRE